MQEKEFLELPLEPLLGPYDEMRTGNIEQRDDKDKDRSNEFRFHEDVPFGLKHELQTQKETLVLEQKLQAEYVNIKLTVIVIGLLNAVGDRSR